MIFSILRREWNFHWRTRNPDRWNPHYLSPPNLPSEEFVRSKSQLASDSALWNCQPQRCRPSPGTISSTYPMSCWSWPAKLASSVLQSVSDHLAGRYPMPCSTRARDYALVIATWVHTLSDYVWTMNKNGRWDKAVCSVKMCHTSTDLTLRQLKHEPAERVCEDPQRLPYVASKIYWS